MGEITAGRVIFDDPDCEPLLGVTALESAGIRVDPTGKTLRRLPAIPLKSSGSTMTMRESGEILRISLGFCLNTYRIFAILSVES